MHDEAIVNYRDMIVNMDLGLRWIRDHFGCESRPHSSWQIDVFGHSRANAEMMADMGFDSMYFARFVISNSDWIKGCSFLLVDFQAGSSRAQST